MKIEVGNIISLIVATIVIVAFVLFFLIKVKSVKIMFLYVGIMLIYVGINILSWIYPNMEMADTLVSCVLIVMSITAVIVYQNDFKVIFYRLARRVQKGANINFSDEDLQNCIEEIVKACQTMSKVRTGGLIVIVPNEIPEHILSSGVSLDALVSSGLLESIFNTKAPMHDGAVIIKGNKIMSAGCFLPLTQTQVIAKDLGTRHRAALGITEETDNLSIVVSEENGVISVCRRGELRRYITPERLSDILHEVFGVTEKTNSRKKSI